MYKEIQKDLEVFLKERNWDEYHCMKNLVMALSCECAELLECFTVKDHKDNLVEVKEEIGDCFISLLSIYRNVNFDIHAHLPGDGSVEEHGFNQIKQEYHSELDVEFLVKLLMVRTGFLLEPYIWVEELNVDLPVKTLMQPFYILAALCHLLKFSSHSAIFEKLEKARKKYPIEVAKNKDLLQSMLLKKIPKRGK